MNKSLTISNQPPEQPGMNFALLREEGIEFIQKLAGEVWTDYNLHDPGITILEQLCYAITDLSYRLDFDIEDLLAPSPSFYQGKTKKEESGENNRQFFTAREILPINPLTINDYRKLLIDLEGIKNAWLEVNKTPGPEIYYDRGRNVLTLEALKPGDQIQLNGLYTVFIEKEENSGINDAELKKKIQSTLHRHRNLCEDFEEVKILHQEEIQVFAKIDIADNCDANEVMASIYVELENFISPAVPFSTLKELRAKGRAIEQIFTGPRLKHGFIDDEDEQFKQGEKRKELHTSDLIHIILDIPEVKTIRSMSISSDKSPTEHQWALGLDPECVSKLKDLSSMLNDEDIKFFKGEILCLLDLKEIEKKRKSLKPEVLKIPEPATENDIPIPFGEYHKLAEYETIQNEFPANYGIGNIGLPDSATNKRKAQAKQLQAYLMFFDQILANYFSQLALVKDLFSIYNRENKTYLSQEIFGVPGVRDILKIDAQGLQNKTENAEAALKRRNRFLDHLTARFCEKFTDYSLLLYESVFEDGSVFKEFIQDKAAFLRDSPQIGAERGKAFDYTDKSRVWDTDNVSGLKKRISRMLGIRDYTRKSLASCDDEGFHIVEHLLLRPISGSVLLPKENGSPTEFVMAKVPFLKFVDSAPSIPDPYSFQISFVFPDWPSRFRNERFKTLIEKTVRAETPAHITLDIHWLDREKMKAFEAIYRQWLQKMADRPYPYFAHYYANKLLELLQIGKIITPHAEITPSGDTIIHPATGVIPVSDKTTPGVEIAPPDTETAPIGISVLEFDGQDDYVSFSQCPITSMRDNDFTIEFRINADAILKWKRIIDITNSGSHEGDYVQFLFRDGQLRVILGKNPGGGDRASRKVKVTNKKLQTNQWYHVAGTWDHNSQDLKLYFDGIEQSGTSKAKDDDPKEAGFNIGRRVNTNKNCMKGKIAEVRIWNTVRSQEEIEADMQRRLQGDEPGLVGYWRFSEGAGDTVKDFTKNTNTGTIHGAQWVTADELSFT